VTKATLTATADNKSRLYGDPNPALTITYTGFKNSETAAVIDTLPTASTTAVLTSNVGTYPITPAGGTDNNYTFSFVNGTLTVTKATLTATADNKSRLYGDANPALTITYTGFKNSETASVIDTPPAASTTSVPNSTVGTYPITPSGGTDNNYSYNYVNGTLTVNKALLTATADNKSRFYGDPNRALSITYSGFKNSESASVLDVAPTATVSAVQTSDVGTYPIVLSGGSDSNYEINLVDGSLIIVKATLTVMADNQSKSYGEDNPTFTLSFIGFKNDETASVLDTPPLATCAATATSLPGTYPISVSGGSDNNYTFTYLNGTLTILKLSQAVTFAPLADVTETSPPFSLTAVASSGLPVAFSTTTTTKVSVFGSTVTVTAPGQATLTASQSGDALYEAATPVSQTICILPAKPTITASGLGTTQVMLTSSATTGNQWYRNGVLLSGATGTMFTVSDEGLYTVQASVDGCTGELSDIFSIIVTDIIKPLGEAGLILSPNPASDELHIAIQGVGPEDVSEGVVYDVFGRVVARWEVRGGSGAVSVRDYAPGSYVLRISSPAFVLNSRFIKK
jgi:hypothetical protein